MFNVSRVDYYSTIAFILKQECKSKKKYPFNENFIRYYVILLNNHDLHKVNKLLISYDRYT